MSSPSPLVTVQDGAGTPVAAASGAVAVTAGNVITIALIDATAATWSLTLAGQDDSVSPPTVTINQVAKTATFTAATGPWALRYQSQVNNGNDVNGQAQASYTATFKIVVATTNGAHLLSTNETSEESSTFGWISIVNTMIRSGVVTRASVTKSATYALLSTDGDLYAVLGGGSFTVTFPASPRTDETHAVKDRDGASGTHALTLNGNGHNFEQRDGSAAGTYTISTPDDAPLFKWNGTSWSLF